MKSTGKRVDLTEIQTLRLKTVSLEHRVLVQEMQSLQLRAQQAEVELVQKRQELDGLIHSTAIAAGIEDVVTGGWALTNDLAAYVQVEQQPPVEAPDDGEGETTDS